MRMNSFFDRITGFAGLEKEELMLLSDIMVFR
jgi:hypothetical protein